MQHVAELNSKLHLSGCSRPDDQVEANALMDNSLSFPVMSVWQAERMAFHYNNCREQATNFWPSNLELERRFSVSFVWFVD